MADVDVEERRCGTGIALYSSAHGGSCRCASFLEQGPQCHRGTGELFDSDSCTYVRNISLGSDFLGGVGISTIYLCALLRNTGHDIIVWHSERKNYLKSQAPNTSRQNWHIKRLDQRDTRDRGVFRTLLCAQKPFRATMELP